jgi:pimeloyl-ACP methyl ester carboxylesterase
MAFGKVEARSSMSDGELNSPPLLFVLIHGTHARNAQWTLPSSELSNALRQEFGDSTIIEKIDWGGGNSFEARFLGTLKLASKIQDLHGERPRRRIFLIGHSHGGNVAAYYASRDPENDEIAGLICLSTPFFWLDHRMPKNDLTWFANSWYIAIVIVIHYINDFTYHVLYTPLFISITYMM